MTEPAFSLEEKHYDPRLVEQHIFARWEAAGIFTAQPDSGKPPYCIMIPPPNVTGRLHMGHALNNALQDVLSRYKRMDGYDVLWMPGTDHAGISTQSIVKKHLDAQGIDWRSLGRDGMVARIWEWKEIYGGRILEQLKRLGCSCDWTRTRFTMDEDLSFAVRTAFVRLFEAGLIYRGKYIVNWCPVDRTALSDDEVETKDGGEPGFLWHIRYPLADGSGYLTVATTRPETMLGDVAVAVHPSDGRYTAILGKEILLPLTDRRIPIVADEFVDPQFGTGCVKITPAHDPHDFQVAVRHNLPMLNIMNEDATMNDLVPERYRGLDRFVCRERVEQDLAAAGLLDRKEDRMTPVGRSYRSRAIIEYRLSDQWFVRMRPLADEALAASKAGKVTFFPERWDSFYRDWLERTRDWCISRQLWWGHRIPAWYHRESGKMVVAIDTPPEALAHPDEWYQDEDVLDTWFSSALWPYSTLGWPRETRELSKYYPTSVLVTGKDIIFFWVARMVMTGLFNMRDVPFRQVLINPIILDERGETMSKSKGNGIDPLHVIDGAASKDLEDPILEARPADMQERLARIRKTFPEGFQGVGADALRFTLLSSSTDAQQTQVSLQRFAEIGRPFTDKLWNATRLVATFLDPLESQPGTPSAPATEDRWILGRLDETVEAVRAAFDSFAIHRACEAIYHFFWSDFCDWYLELIKGRVREGGPSAAAAAATLSEVFSVFLRLLHPLMPYLTEALWGILRERFRELSLRPELWDAPLAATAPFPAKSGSFDAALDRAFELHRDIARAVRAMRAAANLAPKVAVRVELVLRSTGQRDEVDSLRDLIVKSAGCESLQVVDAPSPGMTVSVLEQCEVHVDVRAHIDVDAERARNQKLLEKAEAERGKLAAKLENEQFVARAPQQLVDQERARLKDAEERIQKLTDLLRSL